MKKGIEMEPDDLLCSRNARPQMDAREQADRSSCSQSPHDKTVVARCAQWKINQPPCLKRYQASLEESSTVSFDGRSRTDSGQLPEKTWNGDQERQPEWSSIMLAELQR